jgi:hypothetical protein
MAEATAPDTEEEVTDATFAPVDAAELMIDPTAVEAA